MRISQRGGQSNNTRATVGKFKYLFRGEDCCFVYAKKMKNASMTKMVSVISYQVWCRVIERADNKR